MSAALALTACSGDDSGDGAASAQAKADAAAAKQASSASIKISPKDGADNVSINDAVKVTVKEGKLTAVTLKAASGEQVPGEISADGLSWEPGAELEKATKYQLTATAKDGEGRKEVKNTTFTTLSPGNAVYGVFTPEDGSTVGVGMPVSINFTKPVQDRAAVQKGITVSASSGQEVVGHWFNDTRLDFRPEQYWKAGSEVTLKLRLAGVEAAPGIFGVQSKDVTFTVGRSQVSTVDVKTKKMTVVRDGKTVRTIPISAGAPDNPTYNGEMVISEKFKETRMNGDTVGFEGEYDIPDVPHAMRLSTSGTFIHGNYWGGKGVFGNTNTSHGCVGLEDVKGANDPSKPGAWFYENSLIGDVVKVVNSPDRTISPDNGLNGWNMSWAEWKAGSAL
ncbi:Ig-like domain-containing protein [Streptomyces capparidis]